MVLALWLVVKGISPVAPYVQGIVRMLATTTVHGATAPESED